MKHATLGLRIFAVAVLSLAPALVAVALGWPGALTVGLFALGSAAAGTVAGGLRFGVIAAVTIAVAALVAIPLNGHPWAIALVMVALGGIYGFWAARGYASGALLIPALVPYLVRDPPGIFTDATPTINIAYLAAFLLIWISTGIWTALVMSRLVLKGKSFAGPTQPDRPTIVFGLLLGAVAGIVAAVAMTVSPADQWPWIVLTMFILANPTGKIDRKQVRDRVLGTVIALGLALLLSELSLSAGASGVLALVLITAAMVIRIEKRPYWVFVMVMTPAIILMDSTSSSPEQIAEQRLIFTLMGAAIIIALALLANLAWSIYLRKHPRDAQAETAAVNAADNTAN